MSGSDGSVFDLVKTLCELSGPVGHEDAVQDWIVERWGGFCQEVRRTRVDNVITKVGGSGPRLLLMGHADEICLMVKSIHDEGFLHLWPYYADTLGHPPKSMMPLNQPALVVTGSGTIEGVFATASGHVVGGQRARQNEPFQWNDWFVDIGVTSREGAEALGIHPGCRVIWNPPVRRLGASHIVGKAMDDRAALAIATLAGEALAGRDDLAYELWLASTVQEENGLIGASSVMDELNVDRCIALDVGLTGDIPGPDRRDFPCTLGGGPTVVYKDNSAHYSRKLSNELVATARDAGIPVQQAIFANYGSDGASLLRRGVETALLTYPTRYTHSPIETVDERDLRACVDLVVAFATSKDGNER
ncbi:MAG: M42 family metallopeptidase [Thermomicrobiales bacterium]